MRRNPHYPGLHRSTINGVAYCYAWKGKGAPRLYAPYGSDAFKQEWLNAQKLRDPLGRYKNSLQCAIDDYRKSRGKRTKTCPTGYRDLSQRTRDDYEVHLPDIEKRFGQMPLSVLSAKGARDHFVKWRDAKLETMSARQVQMAWTVLNVVLNFAVDRQFIPNNPLSDTGTVYAGNRKEIIWTWHDEAAFVRHAPPMIALAVAIGIWTAQRPGDVLAMKWTAYDGESIHIFQRKTRKHVWVPCPPPLKDMLDAAPRRGDYIVCRERKRRRDDVYPGYTYGGFYKEFYEARAEAAKPRTDGLPIMNAKVSIGDTRGTCVTRMRRAGCTNAEIGAITGHSNAEINTILERHYAATDPELAISAIRKYATLWGNIPKSIPKTPTAVQSEPSRVLAISEGNQGI